MQIESAGAKGVPLYRFTVGFSWNDRGDEFVQAFEMYEDGREVSRQKSEIVVAIAGVLKYVTP
ncbi:MAG: hypothetical protein Kow0089_20890 [Desulfobulbaceae bacterium]